MAKQESEGNEFTAIFVRMKPDLAKRLKAEAKKNKRSAGAQAALILEEHYQTPAEKGSAT